MDVVTLALAKNYSDQMVEDLMKALPEDITATGVEVADIRKGFDGTVYETAGEAVREQIKQVKSTAGSMSDAATPIYSTAYGNPLMVSDGTGRAVKELKATLQNAAGFDSVNISITGKNLFDKSRYINGSISNPNMTTFYPVSLYGEYRVVYVPIADGETYTISQSVLGSMARYALTDIIVDDAYRNDIPVYQPPLSAATNEIAGYITFSNAKLTHTFVNKYNRKYLLAAIFVKTDTLTYDEIADSIQLELGATATAVEAYNGSEYTIPIGETVTSGTLDVVNGVFTKTDGTNISVPPTDVIFPEGNIIVSVTNATNISAKYIMDTKKYIDLHSSGGGENPLVGKKIVAIGDSMVYGHTLATDKTWLALIAERNSMTYVNYGRNGCYMTHNPRETGGQTGVYDSVYDRYSAMDNDADYVLVFAGTNDIQQNFTIGDEDSTDSSEFFGALNAITDGLQAKYPTAKIAFITPYARAGLKDRCKKFRDAICVACERGGIPVFDNIKNGGINWDVAAQLTAYTLNDTYHLNEQGMDMASRKYEKFLKQI